MGIAIPQLAPASEDRASGAQVIDGSLRFNGTSQELTRSFSSGNRRIWTWSAWVKRTKFGTTSMGLFGYYPGSGNGAFIRFSDDGGGDTIRVYSDTNTRNIITDSQYRDPSGWYHIVIAVDTTQATDSDRIKRYVNGKFLPLSDQTGSPTWPSLNEELLMNQSGNHHIGRIQAGTYYPGYMSNVTFIDGQALDASYFGFTDPLTNTWRPKKFSAFNNPNNGTTWSDSVSGTADTGWDKTLSFLGRVGNSSRAATGQSLTFTPPSVIPVNTSLRIYARQSGAPGSSVLTVNGTNYASLLTSSEAWITVPETSITSIVWSNVSGNSDSVDVGAIEVDGYFLIDGAGDNSFYLPFDGNSPIGEDKSGNGNNWTPVNFGGSNTIEKATGALPILNTDGGGKTARPGTRPDANASNLVLALPLVGNANDVSNSVNSGSTTKTVTANGNAAASSAQSNFYGGSYYFDGTGDYLSLSSSSDFALGTNDWTVEYFAYPTSTTSYQRHFYLEGGDSNQIEGIFADASGISFGKTNVWAPTQVSHPINQWNHYALVHDSTNMRLYINGIQVLTSTDNFDDSSKSLNIGYSNSTFGGYFTGYLQDFRIYKGVAKYTSNFIPASTNPDILPDTPSGVSGGSKLTKVTDGAVTFSTNTDYLDIPSSSDFAYGTGDFTIEAYIYTRSSPSANIGIVDHRTEGVAAANDKLQFALITDNTLQIYIDSATLISTTNICAPRAWHHVAYCRSGGTGRIFIDGILSGSASDSYNYGNARCAIGHHPTVSSRDFPGSISNLRIVNGTALYTSDFTPPTSALTNVTNTVLLCCQSNTSATAAAVQPTATNTRIPSGFSWWDAGATAGWNEAASNTSTIYSDYVAVALPTSGKIYWETVVKNPATYRVIGVTDDGGAARGNNGYQDNVSGFYYNGNPPIYLAKRSGGTSTASSVTHGASSGTNWVSGDIIMWAVDCDNARMWIGLNGTWYASGNPAAGTNYAFHNMETPSGGNYFKLAYATNSGGPATFEIKTEANSTLLADKGNAAATTLNPFTTDINTVRGQETGYATFNPLANYGVALSNGNLTCTGGNDIPATIGASSGKWYAEAFIDDIAATLIHFGICATGTRTFGMGANNGHIINYLDHVTIRSDAAGPFNAAGRGAISSWTEVSETNATFTTGDVMSVELDLDNDYVKWYKNGILRTHYTFVRASAFDKMYFYNRNNGSGVSTWNFGQKPFKFPPSDGFQPLNASTVRPSTVVARPDQYMKTTLYTGSGPSTAVEVNLGFQPDLVWTKSRTQLYSHYLHDSVRGGNNYLNSDNQNQETVNASNDKITFTGTGYTVFANSGALNESGQGADNVVSWSWKAGGNKNTFNVDDVGYATASAAGLTAGTITPTGASVGTKQGFSIIKYTGNTTGGATVSHGLSQDPKFIMIKNLDQNSTNWLILHTGIGPNGETSFGNAEYNMFRFDNAVPANYSSDFIFPGSNGVFALGEGGSTWSNGAYNYIAYCWHDVPGLQKFGSYTGNGSGDGTFVELGFRPALLWIKSTGAQGNWVVVDTQRDQYNPVQSKLYADYNGQENVSNPSGDSASLNNLDILSNGFKLRSANTWTNGSQVYIYCAWAEAPSFNLYGAQSNAR